MLRLVLPSGSLQKGTTEMFEHADLGISTPDSRCYEATIDDPRVEMVRWMRPQEIPLYVSEGLFDVGIAGYDWIVEQGCKESVELVTKLNYSKQTNRPVRIVVAISESEDINSVEEIRPGSKVTTEYVGLSKEYFKQLGIPVKVEFSYGATEAKIPEIAQVAVELTESGSSLRANRLKIIGTIMESSTMFIANKVSWNDPVKRKHIEDLVTLLLGTLDARGKVLIKMNVCESCLDAIMTVLPSMKTPTVSQLFGGRTGYLAVESVVEKSTINVLIPKLKAIGAEDIIELPICKVIR